MRANSSVTTCVDASDKKRIDILDVADSTLCHVVMPQYVGPSTAISLVWELSLHMVTKLVYEVQHRFGTRNAVTLGDGGEAPE